MSKASVKSAASSLLTYTTKASYLSGLSQVIYNQVKVDEYGISDKTCKNWDRLLTVDEIIAFWMPIQQNEEQKLLGIKPFDDIDIAEKEIMWLNCYADLVQENLKRRARSQSKTMPMRKVLKTKLVDQATSPVATPNQFKTLHTLPPRSMTPTYQKRRTFTPVYTDNDRIKSYKRLRLPSPNLRHDISPGRNIRKNLFRWVGQYREDTPLTRNRLRTDITNYANAMFSGGVFINPNAKMTL